MKYQKKGKDQVICGTLEIITYEDPSKNFMIGKLRVQGKHQIITFRGKVYNASVGDLLNLHGKWEVHSSYGKQFDVFAFQAVEPQSEEGIVKYLSSGRFRGIGPKTARQIVAKFGKKTLYMIDQNPEELLRLSLISEKKLASIQASRVGKIQDGEAFIFLHSLQLSPALIQKVYDSYGPETIPVVRENPYRLAYEVKGIGFKIADFIGAQQKIPKDSLERAKAALLFYLHQLSREGHTCYERSSLVRYVNHILEDLDGESRMNQEILQEAVDKLLIEGLLLEEEEGQVLFLKRFYFLEKNISSRLKMFCESNKVEQPLSWKIELTALEKEKGIQLDSWQRMAVLRALEEKVFIITGGPGTGKTTIVQFILALFSKEATDLILAAPTGKAAKRLSESTGRKVKTIHRLLEYSGNGPKRNLENKLKSDFLILDECSMIDVSLFNGIMNGIPSSSKLLMVGDVDQLPSVGAGSVLRDLLNSGKIPSIKLQQVFRQSELSQINVNAHKIIHGVEQLSLSYDKEKLSDFYLISIPKLPPLEVRGRARTDEERILKNLVFLFQERIPKRFDIEFKKIQILTSVKMGSLGSMNLNRRIQEALFPKKKKVEFFGQVFHQGDKVIQVKNDYEHEVFNGDQGFIVDLSEKDLLIDFEGKQILYSGEEIKNLALAWAITIHKSQGSEYPAVIIMLTDQHSIMLHRNLLYTAVSRGKQLVVLLGEETALKRAIQMEKSLLRHTWLKERMLKCFE